MNDYEAKQDAKRARLEAASDRARAKANAHYKRADLREEASGIPLGQPILVGHHSEKRHRRAIERADNAMRASIEADKRAGDLAARAAAIGTGGISADDPDALAKIEEKLAGLEAAQTFMREANKIIRRWLKKGLAENGADDARFAEYLGELRAVRPGFPAAAAADLLRPDFANRTGFADYQLSNNSAEIRRMKQRRERLAAAAEIETSERTEKGVRIVENTDDNRLQLFFTGKPDDATRTELKSRGFRWARSVGCWQRQLSNGARFGAECVLRTLAD